MFVLIGRRRPVHEQELGAVQPYPLGADPFDRVEIGGQLDVGVQLDGDPVRSNRRGHFELAQFGQIAFFRPLALTVEGEDAFVRIDNADAVGAVDDDQVVVTQVAPRLVGTDDGGDAETAGEDGGV